MLIPREKADICRDRQLVDRWSRCIVNGLVTCLVLLAVPCEGLTASPPALIRCEPADCGLSASRLAAIDRVVEEGLKNGRMPGCVVLVGYKGCIPWLKSYGSRQVKPDAVAMTTDTVFDLGQVAVFRK